jgi:hypothetical protein
MPAFGRARRDDQPMMRSSVTPSGRGHRQVTVAALTAAAVLLLGTGCGGSADDNSGGMGLPSQLDGESYPGPRRLIGGRFTVADNGCFLLRDGGAQHLVVWPADAAHGGAEVVLAVERLARWPDGYWGQVVEFCDPGAREVVVFDSVEADG